MSAAIDPGRRLRELRPLFDQAGGCHLLYDLERTFVVTVPDELREPLARAMNGSQWEPAVLDWLREEDMLTSQVRRSWTEARPSAPPVVTDVSLDMSGACNLGCTYCFEKDIDSRLGPMSEATAEASLEFAFRKAANAPRVVLHFGSGEPLLRFRLLEKIVARAQEMAAARGKAVSFELTTNATLVTPGIAQFFRAQPFNVRVSCDGPADIHDRYRPMLNGRPSFEKVMRGLRLLLAEIPDRLTVNSVICGSTRLRDVWAWARGIGIRHYHVIKVGSFASSESRLHAAEVGQYREDLQLIVRDLLRDLDDARTPLDFQPLTKVIRRLMLPQPITRFCGVAASYLGVASNGKVYPCFRHIGLGEYELGSVHSGVDDEKRLAFRHNEAADVDSRDICKQCWARYLCGGGCYADSVVYGPEKTQPQVQHCPFWQAEIETAIAFYGYLSEQRPADCLRLFGDDLDNLLQEEGEPARFQERLNCS